MGSPEGTVRRGVLMEMMVFAYAAGVASLTTIATPLLGYVAMPVFALAMLFCLYGFWRISAPDSQKQYLFYGLSAAGVAAVGALLCFFAAETTAFSALRLHNSVTTALREAHEATLLLYVVLYGAAAALLTLSVFFLLRPPLRRTLGFAALAFGTLPLLFLLLKLYEWVLPTLSGADVTAVFAGWIAATAAVGYGAFRFTDGSRAYAAAFALLTLAAPPVGAAAFALFIFVRALMPSERADEAASGETDGVQQHARQLKAAQTALAHQNDALAALEAAIRQLDPQTAGGRKKRQTMEKEKATLIMKKIAAEEQCERLRKKAP